MGGKFRIANEKVILTLTQTLTLQKSSATFISHFLRIETSAPPQIRMLLQTALGTGLKLILAF